MGQLEGKTAIVTGGSTGTGLAIAARPLAEGAHVFVTGRRRAARAATATHRQGESVQEGNRV